MANNEASCECEAAARGDVRQRNGGWRCDYAVVAVDIQESVGVEILEDFAKFLIPV